MSIGADHFDEKDSGGEFQGVLAIRSRGRGAGRAEGFNQVGEDA